MTATTPATTPAITPATGSPHARLLGVGAYRPERVVTNEEVCQHIDSSDEWIRQRTGIETRRWADPETTVVDMSEVAAAEAVERAGLAPSDIDAVIVATVSHPYQTPSAAAILTHRIGATPAAAWDVSAGCAGFCHALAQANDLVRGGTARHVLVVGVDKLSDFTDLTDRSTAFLFADGAGAVVVGPSDTPGIGPTVWGSDGAQWETIKSRHSWLDVRASDEQVWPHLVQEGRSVFRWAVWAMAPVAQKAIDAAGITADQLQAFIPHQANMRIIDAMAKQLQLPAGVPIARDIAQAGNTSAASVPLAMHRMLAEGQAPSGGLALLIGYGAGLAYASQVVVLP
ncbi:beta-ketoacyl-ACP synthase III [Quadrisphaera sp. DSM 44207]|uniref:beta-ketoacyl-ACP synthase III n=1 Tax=Quadrisphaera sp. DSM 44207 TaxID=1881057 RepID=UPI000886B605|nr:beta-ketoacyl-ACP synthase III [Quadrisphaera sp. DSM 44207]SDQ04264.1 3-oxoacyl-[acyl-carrier-protein] synthase III [Quadrisphaera sp. DSM 44207]